LVRLFYENFHGNAGFAIFTNTNYEKSEVAQGLRCCATNRKVVGSIPFGVSGFFSEIKTFRSHNGLGVDSASNRNEYQLTTLPPSCAIVTKSGNLNFLEPSGPLRACNGTAFIFYYENLD